MVELKAYRLKKDTIGHKSGEVFVKVHYGEDKMMRATYPYKIVNDIHLDSIKNNFDEWFETGAINVYYLPNTRYSEYYYIDNDFDVRKGRFSSVNEIEAIERALRNICFPTRSMAEAAVYKIKLVLEQFWSERDGDSTTKPDYQFVSTQKEDK